MGLAQSKRQESTLLIGGGKQSTASPQGERTVTLSYLLHDAAYMLFSQVASSAAALVFMMFSRVGMARRRPAASPPRSRPRPSSAGGAEPSELLFLGSGSTTQPMAHDNMNYFPICRLSQKRLATVSIRFFARSL
jgi:hypothetical protein